MRDANQRTHTIRQDVRPALHNYGTQPLAGQGWWVLSASHDSVTFWAFAVKAVTDVPSFDVIVSPCDVPAAKPLCAATTRGQLSPRLGDISALKQKRNSGGDRGCYGSSRNHLVPSCDFKLPPLRGGHESSVDGRWGCTTGADGRRDLCPLANGEMAVPALWKSFSQVQLCQPLERVLSTAVRAL